MYFNLIIIIMWPFCSLFSMTTSAGMHDNNWILFWIGHQLIFGDHSAMGMRTLLIITIE